MKKYFGLLLLIVCMCAKNGTHVDVSNSTDNFEIVLLFEKDGVNIYRFYDAGHYRYFSVGNGKYQPQIQHNNKQTYTDGVIQP